MGANAHTPGAADLDPAEFQALYERLRRHADRRPADRRGALNHITPATMRAASFTGPSLRTRPDPVGARLARKRFRSAGSTSHWTPSRVAGRRPVRT